MKTSFQFDINPSLIKTFFPEERIKDKFKILEILLEACRYMLYNKGVTIARSQYKMILHKDKMSRLLFVGVNKIYSIAFPFNIIKITSDVVLINYKNQFDIDSQNISILLSLLKSPAINSEDCLEFIDPITNYSQNLWSTFRDLLLLEDGYIRYDKDEVGFEKAKTDGHEHRHPLNHIDIFYTNQVTFKLGLNQEYTNKDLIDLMDRKTDSKYLNSR
jgi:hypothetical protein